MIFPKEILWPSGCFAAKVYTNIVTRGGNFGEFEQLAVFVSELGAASPKSTRENRSTCPKPGATVLDRLETVLRRILLEPSIVETRSSSLLRMQTSIRQFVSGKLLSYL